MCMYAKDRMQVLEEKDMVAERENIAQLNQKAPR